MGLFTLWIELNRLFEFDRSEEGDIGLEIASPQIQSRRGEPVIEFNTLHKIPLGDLSVAIFEAVVIAKAEMKRSEGIAGIERKGPFELFARIGPLAHVNEALTPEKPSLRHLFIEKHSLGGILRRGAIVFHIREGETFPIIDLGRFVAELLRKLLRVVETGQGPRRFALSKELRAVVDIAAVFITIARLIFGLFSCKQTRGEKGEEEEGGDPWVWGEHPHTRFSLPCETPVAFSFYLDLSPQTREIFRVVFRETTGYAYVFRRSHAMRIAFLSWEAVHAAAVGGVAVHVWELARAFLRRGHEVHVFTRGEPHQRIYDDVFGVHYHRCPFDPDPDFLREIERMNASMVHYLRETERAVGPFAVIHAHDWLAVQAGLRARDTSPARFAITFHSTEWGRTGTWPERGPSKTIAEIERQAIREAETVIAVSYDVRRELDALYACPDWKLRVIHHGIDLEPFDCEPFDPGEVKKSLGIAPLAPTVLYVGRLTHRKGADLLIQAAPRVLREKPDLRFMVVGEGELRNHLEREAERNGSRYAVHFLGWRGGNALVDLYRACDLVCSPSRSDPFGIVTLSAWAASKPVVASTLGSPNEFLFHEVNGLRVEPSPEVISDAILRMVADFDHLRWLGRNGRVAVETAFTWDKVAERTLQAYASSRRVASA